MLISCIFVIFLFHFASFLLIAQCLIHTVQLMSNSAESHSTLTYMVGAGREMVPTSDRINEISSRL